MPPFPTFINFPLIVNLSKRDLILCSDIILKVEFFDNFQLLFLQKYCIPSLINEGKKIAENMSLTIDQTKLRKCKVNVKNLTSQLNQYFKKA